MTFRENTVIYTTNAISISERRIISINGDYCGVIPLFPKQIKLAASDRQLFAYKVISAVICRFREVTSCACKATSVVT